MTVETASSALISAAPLAMRAETLAGRFAPADDRPALGSNLVIRRQVQLGEVTWVVKNPETVKYYNFDDPEWGLIELFDGTRTRLEIVEDYNRRVPGANIGISMVLEYEEMLRKVELLEQTGARRHLALVEKFKNARRRAAEERAEGFNPFFLLFKVFDPNRFLDRTVRYVRWIWTAPTVVVWSLLCLFTVGIFIAHWEPIWTGTIELYAFLTKPFLDAVQFFFILTIIGAIHEFGHGYATKIYGGEVHDMGIALLYFTPAFYCDTTDSLLFQNKWHRLWVTVAGIYVEGFICAAATILWVLSYPDTLAHELAYKTMLFTGVSTVFFNINPLIKIDGYHALTSVLEISELREESFRYLGAVFQRHILRLNVTVPAASRRKRRIYSIYGTLALLYLGSIMAFIAGLFFNFYTKYFPDTALVLLIATLYYLFRKRVRLLVRVSKLFILDKKELVMSRRARVPLIAAAVIVFLVLGLPWPRRVIQTETTLRPARLFELQAPSDGIVSAVRFGEGALVSQGEVVLRLESPAIESSVAALRSRHEGLSRAARGHRTAAQAGRVYASERRESAVASALQSEETERQRLDIRAPAAGRVLTARLEDLAGRFVTTGSPLAVIGDCRTMNAELILSERMLEDVFKGATVTLQPRGSPWRIARGSIVSVAPASVGGTAHVQEQRAPSHPEKFVALAVFENADGSLLPQMTGRAKIYGHRASYLAQLGRGFRRWIQTMFW